jgi:hypothetical protein
MCVGLWGKRWGHVRVFFDAFDMPPPRRAREDRDDGPSGDPALLSPLAVVALCASLGADGGRYS